MFWTLGSYFGRKFHNDFMVDTVFYRMFWGVLGILWYPVSSFIDFRVHFISLHHFGVAKVKLCLVTGLTK